MASEGLGESKSNGLGSRVGPRELRRGSGEGGLQGGDGGAAGRGDPNAKVTDGLVGRWRRAEAARGTVDTADVLRG